ncbi:hypothetical protein [Atopomonas hussainii]|uniref:hypothetical protein n=1 Tax=Atopomonas hussainii TaxID=1429083 RepID=UPI0009004E01|nr:hypothetical protein [Atopomonas hussainii]
MANTFAMMVVMIGLSLFGKPELAADFGLVHGASVALFYSFSGNARSLILAQSGAVSAATILRMRLMLVVPLAVIATLLCVGVVVGGWLFACLLVMRRAAEWLAEIFLSELELQHQSTGALHVVLIQACLSLVLLWALLNDSVLALPILLVWALSPLLGCLRLELFRRSLGNAVPLLATVRLLLPHFGSTAVIGLSVYVFRLFVLLVAGKQVAGDLFAAYALGGILGAVFSQALGPTMVRREQSESASERLVKAFNLLLIVTLLFGVALVSSVWLMPELFDWTQKDRLFWVAVGCSLVGGVVMVLAQRVRLRILQDESGGDVFGSDMLANILLVACVPFVFYGLGVDALALLYLLGALMSWVFYASERQGFLQRRTVGKRAQGAVLLLIAVAIFLPLFFQLQGGLFDDPSTRFDSGGVVALLPIPLSVLACSLGIVLLGGYSRARLALLSLFFVFVGMLLTSVLLGLDAGDEGRQKLTLLLQYILPMFALVLGQQFGGHEDALSLVAKAALITLTLVLPLQILATLLTGAPVLAPSVFAFSIYQHLQYASLLLMTGFVLALFSLWGRFGFRCWLHFLAPLVGAYIVLSWSLLAMVLVLVGITCFVGYKLHQGWARSTVLPLPALILGGALLAGAYIGMVDQASMEEVLPSQQLQLLEGRADYWQRWTFYFEGITFNWSSTLFGHVRPPERSLHPSALNYYLDFAYNFGMLALLPLIMLVLYTFAALYRRRMELRADSALCGLALVVGFALILDSFFKVGLRQPYSGIIMFFLWGLLLARVERVRKRSLLVFD